VPSDRQYTGKLADPDFRRERARKASLARNTVDAHIRALVDAAPPLTAEQRDKLAMLLRPTVGGLDGPAAA
jgi:hypothetical protein